MRKTPSLCPANIFYFGSPGHGGQKWEFRVSPGVIDPELGSNLGSVIIPNRDSRSTVFQSACYRKNENGG